MWQLKATTILVLSLGSCESGIWEGAWLGGSGLGSRCHCSSMWLEREQLGAGYTFLSVFRLRARLLETGLPHSMATSVQTASMGAEAFQGVCCG